MMVKRRLHPLRLHRHYLNFLTSLNGEFIRRDEHLSEVLAAFDRDWLQIRPFRSQACQDAAHDAEAAQLCLAFPLAGEDILEFRQPPAERVEWIMAALAIPGGVKEPSLRARLLFRLGGAHFGLGDLKAALHYQEECLRIGRETGDWYLESSALSALGHTCNALENPGRALDLFAQRLRLARSHADQREESHALGDLSSIELGLGKLREAIAHDEQRLEIAREEGNWSQEGYALSHLFAAFYRLGDLGRSRKLAEQQLALAQRHYERNLEGYALGNLGAIAIREKHLDRAIELYERRRENAERIGDRQEEGFALGDLGALYTIRGEMEKARACYQRRLDNAVRNGLLQEHGYALGNLGSLCEDIGDLDGARDFYLRRWENAELTGMREEKIFAAGNLGMLELLAGRTDRALVWYGQKLALARESKDLYMQAQVLTNLSMTYLVQGARKEARTRLADARKIYRELSRALPLRFRFCVVLLFCPPFLLPAVVAATKRLRSALLQRGIRYRIEYLRA
jgi:tetratricopeptide (TPR) repeat protein